MTIWQRLAEAAPNDPPEDEAAFKALWLAGAAGAASPFEMAVLAGAVADDYPYFFVAGYQAAQRASFGDIGEGWAALVASEDRSESDPLPGVMLSEGVLNGVKTWVAAAANVDTLLVTVKTNDGVQLYKVPAGHPGVAIELKTDVSFLPGLSQGRAHFDGVTVDEKNVLESAGLKNFSRAEPTYLYTALAASCYVRSSGAQRQWWASVLQLAQRTAAALGSESANALLAELDQLIQSVVPSLPDGGDRKLITMYTRAIQARGN